MSVALNESVACFWLAHDGAHGGGLNDRASFDSTHDALESLHSSRSDVTPPLPRVLCNGGRVLSRGLTQPRALPPPSLTPLLA